MDDVAQPATDNAANASKTLFMASLL
jgi:hypothetical protein